MTFKQQWLQKWREMSKSQRVAIFVVPMIVALISGLTSGVQGASRHEIDQPAFIKGCKDKVLEGVAAAGQSADAKLTQKIDSYCACSAKHVATNFTVEDIEGMTKHPERQARLQKLVIENCAAILQPDAAGSSEKSAK